MVIRWQLGGHLPARGFVDKTQALADLNLGDKVELTLGSLFQLIQAVFGRKVRKSSWEQEFHLKLLEGIVQNSFKGFTETVHNAISHPCPK